MYFFKIFYIMSSFKSPADTAKAVASAATAKGEMPIVKLAILGFLAGAYIAFGGLLAEVANTGAIAGGVPVTIRIRLVFLITE